MSNESASGDFSDFSDISDFNDEPTYPRSQTENDPRWAGIFQKMDEDVALQVFEEEENEEGGPVNYKTMSIEDVAKKLSGYERIVIDIYNHLNEHHKGENSKDVLGMSKILYAEGSHLKKLDLLNIKSYCSCDYSFSTDVKCREDISLLDDEKLKCLMDSIVGASLGNERFISIMEKVCDNNRSDKELSNESGNDSISYLEF